MTVYDFMPTVQCHMTITCIIKVLTVADKEAQGTNIKHGSL